MRADTGPTGPTDATSVAAVTAVEATTEDFSDVSPSLSPAPSWAGSQGVELALVPTSQGLPPARGAPVASGKGKNKARHLFVQPCDTGSSGSTGTGLVGGEESTLDSAMAASASAAFLKGPQASWRSPEQNVLTGKGP